MKLHHLSATAALSLGIWSVAGNYNAAAQGSSDGWKSAFGAELSAGYDIWKGYPDGTWPQNSGPHVGANLAYLVVPNQGIGLQAGASYGATDFGGRGSSLDQSREEQTFFTGGLFYRGPEDSMFNAGVVYDMMVAHAFGVAATDVTLQQIRGQIAFKPAKNQEVGLWGAAELNRASTIPNNVGVASYRGIDQASIFYQYEFEQGATLRGWLGEPLSHGMASRHAIGTWLAGARATAPLTDRLSLYAEGMYLSPYASVGNLRVNEVVSISFGLTFHFGAGKANGRNTPYLPIANNSTFLVDGSNTF